MQNPFVYGEIVPDDAFVDREAELDRLVEDLGDAQKVFLISPRRYGKSSLVRQALAALSRRGALTVEVTVSSYSSYVAFLEGLCARARRRRNAAGARAGVADRAPSPRPGRAALRAEGAGLGALLRGVSAGAHRARRRTGWPTRSSRCPGGWPPSASARSSSRSTSSRPSRASTAGASSTRCAPPRSSSGRWATCSPAPSPA